MEYNINDIKPCPFCGFGRPSVIEGIISIDARRLDKATKICCGNCGAQIIKRTTAEAIEVWNRRTLKITSSVYNPEPLNFDLNEIQKALTNDNGVQAAIADVIRRITERNA